MKCANPECGKEFNPNSKKQKYCSIRCGNRAYKLKRRERLKARNNTAEIENTAEIKTVSYALPDVPLKAKTPAPHDALGWYATPQIHTCKICGKPFLARHCNTNVCLSPQCSMQQIKQKYIYLDGKS